ncbi:MAG: LysM peptidoglycan-binding domain-containing protein, partial [Mariprofundales bacterium]
AKRTFFHLRPSLPKETRAYVPRFLASIMLASEASRYGFSLAADSKNVYIMLPRKERVSSIAAAAGISSTILYNLNNDLFNSRKQRLAYIPTTHYILRIPSSASARMQRKYSSAIAWHPDNQQNGVAMQQGLPIALVTSVDMDVESDPPPYAQQSTKRPQHTISKARQASKPARRASTSSRIKKPARPKVGGKYVRYKVQSGNKLSDIAHWFAVSTKELRGWNKDIARSGKLRKGQTVLVYGLPYSTKKTKYKVKSGDSLGKIATRYNVELASLRSWNGVRGNTIHRGQTLVVYHYGAAGTHRSASSKSGSNNRRLLYTVQHGNFLAGIADVFGVSSSNIKRWNKLRSSRLKVGQKLIIYPTHKIKKYSYRVRKGQNLALVASKVKVSMLHLQIMNGIVNSSQIQAGSKLSYYK